MPVIDGERQLWAFVMVLGYSRALWGELLALLEAGAPDATWDAGGEDDGPTAEPAPGEDALAPDESLAESTDLQALDALIERAMAPLEQSGPMATSGQYRRAIARFRESSAPAMPSGRRHGTPPPTFS